MLYGYSFRCKDAVKSFVVSPWFCVTLLYFVLTTRVIFADDFVDVLYSNAFRGSLSWISKVDFIGVGFQAILSIMSLISVISVIFTLVATITYLSAPAIFDEVAELKAGGGESQGFDPFGSLTMMKTWVSGKSGTGLDALIGAILILSPNFKEYSLCGSRSKRGYDSDITVGQLMLKEFVPTVMTIFFAAMSFNGVIVRAFAVTVDAMGTFAEHCVSVNYSAFVEDFINSSTGYHFTYSAQNSTEAKFKLRLSKDLYSRVVSAVDSPSALDLEVIGANIETQLDSYVDSGDFVSSLSATTSVQQWLASDNQTERDNAFDCLNYSVTFNSKECSSTSDHLCLKLSDLLYGTAYYGGMSAEKYLHAYFRQSSSGSSILTRVE